MHRHRAPTIWFEVEDFLRYFDHFANPTGLQRVPFEIFVEAERLFGGGRVRFCRLSAYTRQIRTVGFDDLLGAYLDPPGVRAPWRNVWAPARFLRDLPNMVATIARHPGFFLSLCKTALADLLDLMTPCGRFERQVRPGDVLMALGASWGMPRYGDEIAKAKRRYGVRFALLIHDIIPIEAEDFVEGEHAARFLAWLAETLPRADAVFTVSRYSRDALAKVAASAGWPLPHIEVLRLGAGLSDRPVAQRARVLLLPQRFVLFVSTLEIRKNHRLLVRVWQRLIERHGEAVPTLVFAGQVGWMVDDLLAELDATAFLDGRIVLMPDLSDAELREAYQSCLFTVFPSLAEGWGLPVAESLVHGKFCIASNRTAIPEVGGDLIDYFDPSDDDDALAKIERALFERGYLAAREARLADYRPPKWVDCAEALVAALDRQDAIPDVASGRRAG